MLTVILGVIAGVLFASLVAAFVVRGRNKQSARLLPPEERRSPDDLRLRLGEEAKPADGSAAALLEAADSITVDVEQEKPTIALEAPEPSANRLVRLRSRLARSN